MALLRGKRSGGFTLIELVVTLAIVAMVGAIAVPAYLNQNAKAYRATAEHDGAAWAGALTNALMGYTSFGLTPADTNSSITLSAPGVTPATITVSMIAPTPAGVATKTLTVARSPETLIVSSGMAGANWCFATSNRGSVAVFRQSGFVPGAVGCTAAGLPDVTAGGPAPTGGVTVAAPTWLIVGDTSATAFRPNTLLWDSVSCPVGSEPEYRVSKTVQSGIAGSYQQSGWLRASTLPIPAAWSRLGDSTGFRVQARCYYAVDGTAVTSTPSGTLAFTYDSYVPTYLTVDSLGTGTVAPNRFLWDAVTCQTGYAATYQVTQTVQNGVTGTFLSSDWLSAQIFDVPSSWTSGSGLGQRLEVRTACTSGSDTVVSDAASLAFSTYTRPVAVKNLGGQKYSGAPESVDAFSYGAGTPRYADGTPMARAWHSGRFSPDVLVWDATVCPTGFTAYYAVVEVVRLGVAGNFNTWGDLVDSNFTIPSAELYQGGTYGFQVHNDCRKAGSATLDGSSSPTYSFTTDAQRTFDQAVWSVNARGAQGKLSPGAATLGTTFAYRAKGCATGTQMMYRMDQFERDGVRGSWVLIDWTQMPSDSEVTGTIVGSSTLQQELKFSVFCDGKQAKSQIASWTWTFRPNDGDPGMYYPWW